MKKITFFTMSLLVLLMACFTACENRYAVDHTADLVGTWTCLKEDFAEELVIKADGSALSTGCDGEEIWENVLGNIAVKNGVITMAFEDGNHFKGHFDIIPGIAFSIYTEQGEMMTYNYCAKDLSNEVIGMWVCNDGPVELENGMTIQNFDKNGTYSFTGMDRTCGEFIVNGQGTYKVAGDLLIQSRPGNHLEEGELPYILSRMVYAPNSTKLGDVLTLKEYTYMANNVLEANTSLLRVKKYLELPGSKYAYSATYVSNITGEDKNFDFLGNIVNFAKLDGTGFDKFMKSVLFNIEFTDAHTLTYKYLINGENIVVSPSIQVDGNKMVILMSQVDPIYRDIELYAFQDADKSQIHWYFPTTAFENFFANMSVAAMINKGYINTTDTDAIANIYNTIADAVHTINLSIVLKATK